MRKALFFIFASLLVLSCKKDADPVITVSGSSSIEINASSTSTKVKFTTNKAWTATSSESWIKISPASGEAGDVTITLSADENTTYGARTAIVTIKAGELTQAVTVAQGQNDGLLVTALSHEVECKGDIVKVPVKANVDYTVTVDEDAKDWIKVVKTKALSDYTVELNVAALDSYFKREGIVTIAGAGETIPVTIIQKGIPVPVPEGALYAAPGMTYVDEVWESEDQTAYMVEEELIVGCFEDYVIIYSFDGVEGYDLKVCFDEDENVTGVYILHDGKETDAAAEWADSGKAQWFAYKDEGYSYADSDPEAENGYVMLSACVGNLLLRCMGRVG